MLNPDAIGALILFGLGLAVIAWGIYDDWKHANRRHDG